MLNILTVVGGILLVDLILSGDNALVIGAAASSLQKSQRWLAIVLGGGGAILLRLIFTILATLLLGLPFLRTLGGLLLLLIAVRLLAARKEKPPAAMEGTSESLTAGTRKTKWMIPTTSIIAMVMTILVADVTMSLDNVLAVGALAQGNVALLSAGILLSVVILMSCSALVFKLIDALPWLLDGAALLLAWTGSNMILNDLRLGFLSARYPWLQLVIPAVAFAIVLFADALLRMRENQPIETN